MDVAERIDTPLGRLISEKLVERQMRWTDLARKTGLSVEGIKKMCSLSGNPSTQNLKLIAKALQVPEHDILLASAREEPQGSCGDCNETLNMAKSISKAYRAIAEDFTSLPTEFRPSPKEIAYMACAANGIYRLVD